MFVQHSFISFFIFPLIIYRDFAVENRRTDRRERQREIERGEKHRSRGRRKRQEEERKKKLQRLTVTYSEKEMLTKSFLLRKVKQERYKRRKYTNIKKER